MQNTGAATATIRAVNGMNPYSAGHDAIAANTFSGSWWNTGLGTSLPNPWKVAAQSRNAQSPAVFLRAPLAGMGRVPAVEFRPNSRLTASDALLTTQEPCRVMLKDGYFEIDLLTTDSNPLVYPSGWCWEIREDFRGGDTYWFLLPHHDGLPISISTIAPIPAKPPIIGCPRRAARSPARGVSPATRARTARSRCGGSRSGRTRSQSW